MVLDGDLDESEPDSAGAAIYANTSLKRPDFLGAPAATEAVASASSGEAGSEAAGREIGRASCRERV